jgi:hypothetical protein
MNAIYSDHNLSAITEEQMPFERDVYSHSLLVLCLAFHIDIAMCAFMIFFTSSTKYPTANEIFASLIRHRLMGVEDFVRTRTNVLFCKVPLPVFSHIRAEICETNHARECFRGTKP